MTENLHVEIHDGVAEVTLNRPRQRNALTLSMYERLLGFCEKAARDSSLRVVLITGAGDKAFAAGTDIAEFHTVKTADDGLAYEAKIERVLSALETLAIPTIAAIAGACTGGGAAIAACCDLRIATRSMKFGFPIARTLGNCLSVANYARLAHLIGPARVKDLFFTARLMEADEAFAVGVVNELVDDHETLMRRAREVAATVAGHAPLTLRATKEALRRIAAAQTLPPDDDLVGLCYASQDFREGIDSFLAKRAPQWKGR
ncbi:MAG: enoyl-CoA hydratase/isomerase family protein [Rhodoblastus sp.]|nr:enoyl-CoA hydratase/isomerase family protein [Rhodoblastus sp.]MCB1524997.1 enoyl-CoA hydratase/isomerase family protein [Rhodoblastus sp.]MCC2101734.1 enoyl-CoA hydratase/isomerase family protein [Hyphomicrobiales bacterium]MCC2106986.1 enoyl-CoA hydratase/isomerase family protein [Hyphomicrobiales bacterium]HPG03115.1 enoyl-CoA hydratase [Rhodoblastus sp.]